jgi:hypothetical protein
MKVNNAKLLKFLEAIGSDLLGLIMQLIAFSEPIATRFLAEAQHHPKIRGCSCTQNLSRISVKAG